MERGLFRFIVKYSLRDQILLIALAIVALPFLYLTFELPKRIVNDALAASSSFPKPILGVRLDQVEYLFVLCGAFLSLVLVSGALKYFSSTYRYRVGDRLLRRLRYELVERLLRFPLKRFQGQSSGQVVSMVAAETSPLGLFMSEAFTVPTVAIGTLGTVLLFIFVQDWMMGLAAIALYPLQIWLVPKIQREVNELQRTQALTVRGLSDQVSHIIASAPEIHGHDTSQFELATITRRLRNYFEVNVRISSARYVVNILNQFFSQLTPFFFLLIGGYLVIQGEFSLGSLVAVLAAHKDMYAPWKDLIDYYQKAEDARVKYDQLAEFFDPPNLMPRDTIAVDAAPLSVNGLTLALRNVTVTSDEGAHSLEGATLTLPLPLHAAFIGGSGTSRDDLARVLTRQITPAVGEITLGEMKLAALPDSVIGRLIACVGPENFVGSGSFREAIVYPLLRRPTELKANPEREALIAGNNQFDPEADWLDYSAAGGNDARDLTEQIAKVLRVTGMYEEILGFGLRRTLGNDIPAEIVHKLLAARRLIREQIRREALLANAVEPFEAAAYIENATVRENILFGTPVDAAFTADEKSVHPYLHDVLEATELKATFLAKGLAIGRLMAEIFNGVSRDSGLMERFSLIRPEEMGAVAAVLQRAESVGLDQLSAQDVDTLIRLPFNLVAANDPLDLINAEFRQAILRARRHFADNLPSSLHGSIKFFDIDEYNGLASVFDNLLFGKRKSGSSSAAAILDSLIATTVEESGLHLPVLEAGLMQDIGIAGSKLTAAQRQRLALSRALIKQPQILIFNGAMSALEAGAREKLLFAVKAFMRGKTLLLIDAEERYPDLVEEIFDVRGGKLFGRTRMTEKVASEDADSPDNIESRDELNRTVDLLSSVPLFSSMERSKLKLLAFTSEKSKFADGEVVFRQGSTGDRAYIIIKGNADIFLESAAGETSIAKLGRHQFFGEMALLANAPRTTSVRAIGQLEMVALRQDVFVKLVEESPKVASAITQVLVGRLSSTLAELNRANSRR